MYSAFHSVLPSLSCSHTPPPVSHSPPSSSFGEAAIRPCPFLLTNRAENKQKRDRKNQKVKTEPTDNERKAVLVHSIFFFSFDQTLSGISPLRWNTTAGLGILSQSRSCTASSGSSALGCCEGWSTRKTVLTRYLTRVTKTTLLCFSWLSDRCKFMILLQCS